VTHDLLTERGGQRQGQRIDGAQRVDDDRLRSIAEGEAGDGAR
jgi:hypothetical protein